MAQADLNVANQSGSAFRADLNNQLLALGTLMSGASEPSTTYAYMLWADTTASVLKMRNVSNNGWVILRGLEGKLSVGPSAPGTNVNLRLNRDISGASTSFAQYVDADVAASVNTSAIGIGTALGTAAGTSLSSLVHYQAATGTLGAGTSITNQIGFSASSSIDGATNDFGFYGNIGAGSGNWNCYMVGAAPSFFNHQVQIAAGSAGTPSVSTNGDTNTGVYFPVADALGFATGGSERARIDSSGRLLVGTSSSRDKWFNTGSWGNPTFQLETNVSVTSVASIVNNANDDGPGALFLAKSRAGSVGGVTVVSNNDIVGRITFQGADGTEMVAAAMIEAQIDGTPGANDMPGRLVFSTTADGASSPTERMRITQAGNTLIGSGSQISSERIGVTFAAGNQGIALNVASGAAQTQILFANPNGTVGTISTSGSATAYNTSSDYRLKENVVAVSDGVSRLQQLSPCRFNFIADPDKTVDGFIAHEVQDVVPEAITGEKDAVDEDGNPVYQGIDQSKLVPLLTAALQEAIGEIESLKARLTAAGI